MLESPTFIAGEKKDNKLGSSSMLEVCPCRISADKKYKNIHKGALK